MSKKRFRLKYLFWLDVNKEDEYAIAELIDELKEKRSFTRAIRDGIRLICDLRDGSTEVLFELFPWIRSELSQPERVGETPAEIAIREQLERVEKLIVEQGAVPVSSAAPTGLGGIKAMNTPQFDAPTFDDDDDMVLELKEVSNGKEAAENFINSMMNLQH